MHWDRHPISFIDKGETEEIAKEKQRFNRYPPTLHSTREKIVQPYVICDT